jgi:hypothetical protein
MGSEKNFVFLHTELQWNTFNLKKYLQILLIFERYNLLYKNVIFLTAKNVWFLVWKKVFFDKIQPKA